MVVPFGSTEQHGRHLPLATDSVMGDEFGWAIADRLDAFLAPMAGKKYFDDMVAFFHQWYLEQD